MGRKFNLAVVLGFYVLNLNCVRDRWEVPARDCAETSGLFLSLSELKETFPEGLHRIEDDLLTGGIVISSDREGNFFNSIIIQDSWAEPRAGISILLDFLSSYSYYPVGSQVRISLKGMYISSKNGLTSIGSMRLSFGNPVLSNLTAKRGVKAIKRECTGLTVPAPVQLTLAELNDSYLNQLVEINGLEFEEDVLGLPMADPGETTRRVLEDCHGLKLVLRNSGFSDFADQILPSGNGSITGILTKRSRKYELLIRRWDDLNMSAQRCRH